MSTNIEAVYKQGTNTVKNIEENMNSLSSEVFESYRQWVLLLTDGEEVKINRVLTLYNNNKSWGSAIMTLRKQLRQEGEGVVDPKKIAESYKKGDKNELRALLSKKCLEYLTPKDVDLFLSRLEKRGWDIEKAMAKIDRRPNARLLSVVL